jgi:beta-lactamase superfamily II metal-dependent hydrolase
MPIRYVTTFTSKLVSDDRSRITELLWGDPVHVTGPPTADGYVQARARAQPRRPAGGGPAPLGWVKEADLGDQSKLLELYVIDVGQGDSVLVRTPDDKWHLIDGGNTAERQMLKKGAANFVRWKFLDDLRRDKVSLHSVLLTHADTDHFGGLINMLSGRVPGRDPFTVEVDRFFHTGIAQWKDAPTVGAAAHGDVPPPPIAGFRLSASDDFLTELVGDKATFAAPARPFADTYAELAQLVATVPATAARLSRDDAHLPGYAPGDGDVVVHVLGPVMETLTSGVRGLRALSSPGKTKNGHSLVLRFDYGDARFLLTGDLNAESQRLLLSYVAKDEFAVDVAKACHHGAEDVDLRFVQSMQARATVISSGDSETFAHPRPALMGASARYGREARGADGELVPPLVYSTELARSVALARAAAIRSRPDQDGAWSSGVVDLTEVKCDAGSPRTFRPLAHLALSTDLVYGLVNVRTDGRHVLCATLEESGTEFDTKVFRAGAQP